MDSEYRQVPNGMTRSSATPAFAGALAGAATDARTRGGAFSADLSVTRLSLTNFRCYAQLRLEVGPGPIVLTGPNGAGKTNLLEALSFLSPGRGLRRARLADPDRRTHDGTTAGRWAVAAVLNTAEGPLAIGTGRDAGDDDGESPRRVVRIDGAPGNSQAELAHKLSVVWLTPDMDRLFDDSASERRRFLDRLVYAFDPAQAGRLAAYEHRMRERARLLAEGRGDPAWLDAIEEGMAAHGVAIAAARVETAARLDRACAQGLGPFPQARLALAGELDAWLAEGPALAAEERLRAALSATRSRDALEGSTIVGPHRSDLDVRFGARGTPARECSTGEQKALLLSIVLGLAREIARERGKPPLLLLDEAAAHLDGARRAALYDEIASLGVQAWLSGADEEFFAGLRSRARFFRVLDATVTAR